MNLLFLATLAILMVPYATILIPLYVVLGHLVLRRHYVEGFTTGALRG
jgi:multiple sugar transport system permease protein